MARGTEGIAAYAGAGAAGDARSGSVARCSVSAALAWLLLAQLFQVVKYSGAAYLLFLASGSGPFRRASGGRAGPPDRDSVFGAALLLSMGNPKIMLFYLLR